MLKSLKKKDYERKRMMTSYREEESGDFWSGASSPGRRSQYGTLAGLKVPLKGGRRYQISTPPKKVGGSTTSPQKRGEKLVLSKNCKRRG